MVAQRVLGIDLGPNSIGWALVDDDPENTEVSQLVDIGVRVFPEGVDAFDTGKESSRNEKRRTARGMRRQVARRKRRHRYLKEALQAAGLWPTGDQETEETLCKADPYQLRAKALEEKLSPHEIGRILLHLNQRRGFKSNRKRDRADKEVQGMLAEINDNEKERTDNGFKTIGAWLAGKGPAPGEAAREYHRNRQEGDHVRGRHLARLQYKEEFEAIWEAQAEYYPKLLTETLKYGNSGKKEYPCKPQQCRNGFSRLQMFGIYGLLFFQRPMYWPKSVIGLCELEPKQKRCPKSDRRYQRFRLLQEINNLRYIDPDTHLECALTEGQRQLLLEKLNRTKEMPFDRIRKALGFLETVKFNLERGSRTKLLGVPIDAMLATSKVFGKKWYDRPEDEKSEIVAFLLDDEKDDQTFIEQATSKWGMTREQADLALGVDIPAGYGNLSLMALKKLLPHMEKGLLYMAEDETNSAMHAAGYLRPDQLRRRIFDKLPNPQRARNCPIGDIPNPVVKRTLTEVRRVVNAIIREYGKPDTVHIEMARSVQLGKERRKEVSKRMREREKTREAIAEKLRENGWRVNRDNILKYLLWEQQGGECIYSGEPISLHKLFGEGGGIDVDHILPRSRTLDDSQMNKVICLRSANVNKSDQTPYEWFASSKPEQYEQVCQRAGGLMRAGKFPYQKYRRFIQKELKLDDFIARQLTDTGYITKATAEYMRCLFEKEHKVLGLKGQLTAELRWHWGLETILSEISDSPAWQEQSKLKPGEKNRADHRHHAIDALVIALTNRTRLQQLSKTVKAGGAKNTGETLPEPWKNFRNDILDAVKGINVSHRVERKVRGALHKEKPYGPTSIKNQWVRRKSLVDLSADEVLHIRDTSKKSSKRGIRQIVIDSLLAKGIDIRRKGTQTSFIDNRSGKVVDKNRVQAVLSNARMPSGVPIKKARILIVDKSIKAIREGRGGETFVKPGSTHHLCIYEWEVNGQVKRDAVFVDMLTAAKRLKNKEPIIQCDASKLQGEDRERIPPDARFVMSLSNGEMVLAKINGVKRLLKLRTSKSTESKVKFQFSEDARRKYKEITKTCNTLLSDFKAQKVTVDPLGRIYPAND